MTQVVAGQDAAPVEIEVDYDPFAGGALSRVVPTTEPQREVWLAARLGDDASLAFNESVSLRLRGALDVAALGKALQEVVARHDALRASFGPDGETFCVLESGAFALPLTDLSALSAQDREARVASIKRAGVDTPFRLEAGQLFQSELLRLSADEHLLVMNAHHIVCDGWSWWVIVRELGQRYAQHRDGSAGELPASDSYADYALSEAVHPGGAEFRADEAYWLSRFPGEAPVLDLPSDHPRPARRCFAALREDYVLDAELVSAIRRLGARRGASLFATLLGGFAGLLSRISGQSEIVVGIPAAGQSVDGHSDLVGHCVNLLPLRFDIDPTQPFAHVLDEAQNTLLDAIEHQRYTFGTLLKKLRIDRDPSRLPLVSVMFNIDQALDQEKAGFPGLELEFGTNPRSHENFELSINAVQVQGTLRLECQYHSELFDQATIRRWLSAYEALLRAAVQTPDEKFANLSMLDADSRTELQALQPPATAFDRECRMHEHFEQQCDRDPHRIAVRFEADALSYAELETRANRIAHLLRAEGVRHGSLVGLAMDRGIDMLAGLLGILKAGAGYVPLDPQFPPDRLAYMAGDAGLAALLTQSWHAQHFDLRGRPVLKLDALRNELDAASTHRIGRDEGAAQPESVAYVIYTSGSTGRPKGVQVPHRAVSNFLASMAHEPGIDADDVLVAVTTLSFDIAVLELMLPLKVGAQVVLASRDTVMDGGAFMRLLEKTAATIVQATPAMWRLLLDAGWSGNYAFKALCGGEPLPPDLAAQLLPRCGQLWNLYGPTETTVWSTCARIIPDERKNTPDIHIGKPIFNTQVWILDAQGELCPRGVPGEICIGGEGVTLGYLQRPELTAERFVPDRFGAAFGTRTDASALPLYRTGDRGRWRADGNLEHMGRLDFQVKIRGYRIELGEIEANLSGHTAVSRSIAMAREDRPGDLRLVAYVALHPGAAAEEAQLTAHLRATLPDYMVPQHIVALESLPLLPNGKIDRKALPPPSLEPHRVQALAAPRNELERRIADTMAKVLGLSQIGIHDNFFAMGGHSLLAAKLCARLTDELGVKVPLRALFSAPCIAQLADALKASLASANPSEAAARVIPHRAQQARAPMTPMQQRLWVLEQMDPGGVVYNTPSAHRLRGPMDLQAFEKAFQEMIRRQASLRTTLVAEGDGAVQQVLDALDFTLLLPTDLSALPEAERDAELMRQLEAMTATPFVLDRAPLFRAKLYRLGEQDHVLYFMTHHAIWDGWSFDVFYSEMSALYEAYSAGLPSPLPELEVTYGDFAEWHRQWLDEGELHQQLAHWKQHLAGELEPLHLPEDFQRPALASGKGSTEWVKVDRATADAMREIGTQAGATLFMTLLTAYYVLLHRLTGQADLVVGLPVRNRSSEALEKVMGFFVNALPLRLRIDPETPFLELVGQVREAVIESFAYPDVPFEHLVRELKLPRDQSRSPLYQALFSFQDVRARKTRWGRLEHEHLLMFQKGMSIDLGLWFLEHDQGLSGAMGYNTDILSTESAALINRRFVALLQSFRQDPRIAIGRANLLCEEDRNALAKWNSTAADMPSEQTVHALLASQVGRTPSRSAIRFNGEAVTYSRLHTRSTRIADALMAHGVRAGDLVGVSLDRHPDLIATLIAVWKLGAAYVPLDPAYPADRLRFMVADAGLAMVVSEGDLATPLNLPRERLLLLDADADRIDAAPALVGNASTDPANADSLAYVIYTSGSTGTPKGVQVHHGAVLNFLRSMAHQPGMAADDRLLAVTTTSFDIAALELFLPLSIGAEIVLASRDAAMDGQAIAAMLDENAVTVMQATPSTWRMLIDAGWKGGPAFKALCGGEPLPADLALQLLPRCGELWNMYGPTETTVWSTCTRIRPATGAAAPDISIGTPIANTSVWVLDPQGGVCPPGVSGELYIGGAGVTQGYLHKPELTNERFVPDFLVMQESRKAVACSSHLYRTGDRGRWRIDGTLEHQGRLDFQVKVRGHRIELGEIEVALAQHPGVARALAIVREDRPGDVRLVGYVVAHAGASLVERELMTQVRERLPQYMVPQHIVGLPAIPLLPNGKIDRNALPSPLSPTGQASPTRDLHTRIEAESQPPASTAAGTAFDSANAAESRHSDPRIDYLGTLWSELLGVRVAPQDNFFDLGGHSMLAVQMANRVARETGVRLKLISLATQNLSQVASALPETPAGAASAAGLRTSSNASGRTGHRLLRYFRRIWGGAAG